MSVANHKGGVGKFQPTPLHEERRGIPIGRNAETVISTHAPARGATSHTSIGCVASVQFQPTPLHEERR